MTFFFMIMCGKLEEKERIKREKEKGQPRMSES